MQTLMVCHQSLNLMSVSRNVEWLTASTESSVNFTPLQDLEGIVTPNGLCFERHHGGTAIINPVPITDLMINGLS